MSDTRLFMVGTNGDVVAWEEVLNGAAYVFPLLDTLMERYGIDAPEGHAGLRPTTRYRPLFVEFGTNRLSWEDDLALATVYPEAWVAKEHLPALLRGLRCVADTLPANIHPTIRNVADALERLMVEPSCRGVAFDVSNQAGCFWSVDDDPDGDGNFRPYNVDTDAGRFAGRGDAFEAGAELMRLRTRS